MTSLKLYTNIVSKSIEERLALAGEILAQNTARFVIEEFTKFPKEPVLTGNLRRSIRALSNNETGIVTAGSTVFETIRGQIGGKIISYASFVEFGTSKMPARPFFRNGTERAKASNQALLEKLLKNI